jgi:hypothetical protein
VSKTTNWWLPWVFAAIAGCVAGGEAGPADPHPEETVADVAPDASPDLPSDVTPGDAADTDVESTPDVAPEEAAQPTTFAATPGHRCAPAERVGLVLVSASEWSPGLDASATVWDRPNPWLAAPALADASCAFHQYAPGFCESCPEGQVCGLDSACTTAQAEAAGAVLTLSIGGEEQAFPDSSPDPGLWGQVTLPGRTFAVELAWSGITVTLAETTVPSGVAGLSGTMTGGYDSPEAVDLKWTPPAEGGEIHTNIPINHHASGPTFTECAVDAAAGKLHVDGAMLKPLAVVTGLEFQGIEHVRFAAADTPLGCVEIRFQAMQYVSLSY